MNLKSKLIILMLILVAVLVLATGCGTTETPYDINDEENYTVSVKYDANGGTFTTNTSVIVDSYNVSALQKDENNVAKIALLSPDNEARGTDAFSVVKNGYFLAGWYAERTETVDAEGNKSYTYHKKWDFEQDLLEVDTEKTYSASQPVITLYAAWVPLFEIEFYSLDSKELLGEYTYNPLGDNDLRVPTWNLETGAMDMYEFPNIDGFTFEAAYYDEAGTQAVDTEAVMHTGVINEETATAENNVMKLYLDLKEGNWYHIYTVEQFLKNASVNGNYVIHADLDFSEKNWPTSLMYGNFNGVIEGNGHTFKNIAIVQKDNSKTNAGLFGSVTEKAKISDVTFDTVTFTIQAGSRVAGTSYGVFAGTVSSAATLENIQISNGTLQIDSGCYFSTDAYSIGLICGTGDVAGMDASAITCTAVGTNPEQVIITVDDKMVTVQFEK